MRRNSSDNDTLSLLKQGADAAKQAAQASNEQFPAFVDHVNKINAQMGDQIKMLQYSLGNIFKTLNSYPAVKAQLDGLDYRTLGMLRAIAKSIPNFEDLVEQEAMLVREESFNELSAEDDANRKLIDDKDGVVTENSVIILTTSCAADPNKALFRSKIDVGGPEIADTKELFLGKKVGETFEVPINGIPHAVTLLGLRKLPDASKTN